MELGQQKVTKVSANQSSIHVLFPQTDKHTTPYPLSLLQEGNREQPSPVTTQLPEQTNNKKGQQECGTIRNLHANIIQFPGCRES